MGQNIVTPKVCIYKITIDDYYYFGSSIEYPVRKRVHVSRLNRGVHTNRFMQSVFNKYKTIDFQIMQICDQQEVAQMEQIFIDEHFGNKKCMNLSPSAENNRGWRHTENSKLLLSQAAMGRNKNMSINARERCRQGSAKLNWDDVNKMREMYSTGSYSQKVLATMFGTDQTNVSLIVRNKHWKVA
jgi:hypothetical protein